LKLGYLILPNLANLISKPVKQSNPKQFFDEKCTCDSTDMYVCVCVYMYFSISGAHTFVRSRCLLFVDRLYNFNNSGKPDPTLDISYLKKKLRKICPQNGTGTNLANLDPTTPNKFDKLLLQSQG